MGIGSPREMINPCLWALLYSRVNDLKINIEQHNKQIPKGFMLRMPIMNNLMDHIGEWMLTLTNQVLVDFPS